ncbi:hypothetical protein C7T35_39300 [Variovorax sp. WS11]|uniref:DUF932 domain-containing protein n=1 Tax=Variovorax sp. WS11 TaxID=1105204 RepID=UPI000D0CF842|nr:DUF945 domain-containing protein [Variovorax sp. WS11]PSL79111.1 hypothetical protein C7T35_39300 [Variovorax sp. WS11]
MPPGSPLDTGARAQRAGGLREQAAACSGPKYIFINTRDIVTALMDAGFEPTEAVQTHSRGGRAGRARYLLRFQPVVQSPSLDDVPGEIVLMSSHNGRSAYQLLADLFRLCTSGHSRNHDRCRTMSRNDGPLVGAMAKRWT